eukprot:1142683-Rhodomonas_salina.1
MSGHSDPASSPGAAHRPQHGSWVVLNRDSTWEEIVLDETGNEQVVRRCRVLTDEASASYGRVFDASRLRATCLKFAERRTKLQQRMEYVWKSLCAPSPPLSLPLAASLEFSPSFSLSLSFSHSNTRKLSLARSATLPPSSCRCLLNLHPVSLLEAYAAHLSQERVQRP